MDGKPVRIPFHDRALHVAYVDLTMAQERLRHVEAVLQTHPSLPIDSSTLATITRTIGGMMDALFLEMGMDREFNQSFLVRMPERAHASSDSFIAALGESATRHARGKGS